MKFYNSKKWHFRDNQNRRNGDKNKGKHPSLIVGKTKDNKKFINIGLTHSTHRGHHKNIEIKDPTNWKKSSYLRDDIQIDDVSKLQVILNDYRLHPNDKEKVFKIINKYKKRIPTRR